MLKYKLFTVVSGASYGIPSVFLTILLKLLKSFVHVNGVVFTPEQRLLYKLWIYNKFVA